MKMHTNRIYEKILRFSSKTRTFLKFSFRQPLIKYFETFSIVSTHHKQNGTRLLSPQTEYIQVTSRIVERLKTLDIKKVWENLEIG